MMPLRKTFVAATLALVLAGMFVPIPGSNAQVTEPAVAEQATQDHRRPPDIGWLGLFGLVGLLGLVGTKRSSAPDRG